MDWQGQNRSEQLMQVMLAAFAMAAYLSGFMTESFRLMMMLYAGGVVLTALISVPNWPLFNRHPLNWLEPSVTDEFSKEQAAAGKKKYAKK